MVADGGVLGDFLAADGTSLVARRGCGGAAARRLTVAPKVRNAAAAGAAAVLVYGSVLPAGAARPLRETRRSRSSPCPSGVGRRSSTAGAEGARGDDRSQRRASPNPELAQIAGFSSHGPAYGAAKPDLVAPGVALVTPDAAAGPDAAATPRSPARAPPRPWLRAARARAGRHGRSLDAAALARSWSALRARSPNLAGPVTAEGAGLVDPVAAAAAVLAVEPAALSFGTASEPGLLADRTIRGHEPLVPAARRVARRCHRPGRRRRSCRSRADPAGRTLAPGASGAFRLVVSAAEVPAPATISGTIVVQAEGAAAARVPWTITFPESATELLSGVTLAPDVFAPVGEAPGGAYVPGRRRVRGGGRRRDRSGRVARRRAGDPEGERRSARSPGCATCFPVATRSR